MDLIHRPQNIFGCEGAPGGGRSRKAPNPSSRSTGRPAASSSRRLLDTSSLRFYISICRIIFFFFFFFFFRFSQS